MIWTDIGLLPAEELDDLLDEAVASGKGFICRDGAHQRGLGALLPSPVWLTVRLQLTILLSGNSSSVFWVNG